MAYANPDAVTQIATGYSTTSFSCDDNGNVTAVGTTTFYTYDFDNSTRRLDDTSMARVEIIRRFKPEVGTVDGVTEWIHKHVADRCGASLVSHMILYTIGDYDSA
jgi:hypothetical protein